MPSFLKQSDHLACTVIDGAAVIVDPQGSLLYWLNPVATRVWELASDAATVETIADTLCEEFEVDRETALSDTQKMVQAFTEKKLFQLTEGDDSTS